MNRRMAVLGAAMLALGVVPSARAQDDSPQLDLNWVDTPPTGDAITKRLEDEATSLLATDAKFAHLARITPTFTAHLRTVVFDYFYPATPREYRALGANGVLEISVVAGNPAELPVTRAVLRFGGKDVVLQPIAHRISTMPAGTPLAKAVGVSREDAFYLLPGKLPRKMGDLWLYFSVPGQRTKVGALSLALPSVLNPDVEAGPSDPATLRKVLAREYPSLVKP